MNTRAAFYTAAAISFSVNYFTAPIAGPVLWDSVKSHTAAHLMAFASDLHPTAPTVIPAIKEAAIDEQRVMLNHAESKAMPPTMDLEKLAERYPAANSEFIRQMLAGDGK